MPALKYDKIQEQGSTKTILFHGSRGGIDGDIKPSSRKRCDFGKGFYMGTNSTQAKTLVAHEQDPYLYQLKLDLNEFSPDRITFLTEMDWAYFVLYNRGRLEKIKDTLLYQKCHMIEKENDIIIGPIADDAMNEVMNRFMRGDITDKAFLESIRVIDYGTQYVAKTEYACKKIKIISERELYGKELDDAIIISNEKRAEGKYRAEDVLKKYRREGKYLDEILKEELNNHFIKGKKI